MALEGSPYSITAGDPHSQMQVVVSISNGSGPSLRVRVWVQTELSPKLWSGLSTHPNHQHRYRLMEISEPVWIGRVVSGSPSWTSYTFIYGPCFAVWKLCLIKIVYSMANNLFLHVLQFAISIIWESVFFFWYSVFLPIKVVNSAVMCSNMCVMPRFAKMKDHQ